MNAYTVAILTENTCGEACWCAREEICRCSCGGKNHGILRTPEGTQPVRTSKIDGYRYELLAVGKREELHDQIKRLMASLPIRSEQWAESNHYVYHWEYTEKGSPIRVKYATPVQCEHWNELKMFRGIDTREFYRKSPALIWKRTE